MMTEGYNQQDGGPQTQPDAGENVPDPRGARPAVVGERDTQEGMAGQGLGQISGDENAPSVEERTEKA